MTTSILHARPVAGLVAPKLRTLYRMFVDVLDAFAERKIRSPLPERELCRTQGEIKRYRQLMHDNRGNKTIANLLELSASRAYDSALEILGAYKLTGNFHINLGIVLKELDALDKVTFEVEPQRAYLTDCRRVLFRPTQNVQMGQFSEILASIKKRIGFDATGITGLEFFNRCWR